MGVHVCISACVMTGLLWVMDQHVSAEGGNGRIDCIQRELMFCKNLEPVLDQGGLDDKTTCISLLWLVD